MASGTPAAAELRSHIEAAIESWKSPTEKPPYSFVELITMALVYNGEAMKSRQIIDWIKKFFVYYGQFDLHGSRCTWVGFEKFASPATVDFTDPAAYDINYLWNVDLAEARIYLQPTFGFGPQGSFPFLRLPVELRTIIYEMVFQYPASGLWLDRYRWDKDHTDRFQVASKDYAKDFSQNGQALDSVRRYGQRFEQLSQEALGLLSVNKQIYEESLPFFYRNNLFYCPTVIKLGQYLRRLAPARRQHLRQIAFKYHPHYVDVAPAASRYLASLPNLRKLYVEIDEDVWARFGYTSPLKITGLAILRGIRIDEVVFNGNCPTIAPVLKLEMESKDSKKRKMVEARGRGLRWSTRVGRYKKIAST